MLCQWQLPIRVQFRLFFFASNCRHFTFHNAPQVQNQTADLAPVSAEQLQCWHIISGGHELVTTSCSCGRILFVPEFELALPHCWLFDFSLNGIDSSIAPAIQFQWDAAMLWELGLMQMTLSFGDLELFGRFCLITIHVVWFAALVWRLENHFLVCRFPYYYHAKLAFLLWLQIPQSMVSGSNCPLNGNCMVMIPCFWCWISN